MLTTLLTKLYGGYLMDVNDLLVYAIDESMRINKDEIFLIKDLFKGYEWNRLSINERRNLGRFFFEESQNPYLKNGTIVALEKNSANQQMYQKC